MTEIDDVDISFIGHPFAPIGMGEQLRSHVAACAHLHIRHSIFDVFRYAQRSDPAHFAMFGDRERDHVPAGIRIFHINGDEVDSVIAAFEARGNTFDAGYNIVVPAWELPNYPKEWATRLARFDEVWALSRFIASGLAAAGVASRWIGQSVETDSIAFLPRRFFGIRESAFVLLHFFDLSSYATRKNPLAVLALARRLQAGQKLLDLQVVLKVKDGERDGAAWLANLADVAGDPRVRVIDAPLDSVAIRSLVNCCDCFVSLHRAEGFGRGLGEAMALGKLALGTGWSGNVDFMTETNSLLVRHTQVKLKRDQYPHWRGQSWAEPDVDHAADLLRAVLAAPDRGRALAQRGQADVLRSHGNRAVGLRMLERFEAIVATNTKLAPQPAARPPKLARRRR